MSEKFKITEEEINEALMHSPFVLPDSPSHSGLGAGQIKKYFYDFIRQLSKRINLHMSDIGDDLVLQDKALKAYTDDAITKSSIETQEQSLEASRAYTDEKIRNALVGKTKVHVYPYCGYIFTDLRESDAVEKYNIGVGDVLLNTERGVPDFIVYSTDRNATVANTVTVLVNDEFYYSPDELKAGVAYNFVQSGIVIIGIESGIDTSIDTSNLVTKEELESAIQTAIDDSWEAEL